MKRSPINRVSSKRRASLVAYREARKVVEQRSNGVCEARAFHGCTGRAEDVHHVQRRSQGGSDDPANLLHACHFCHMWIHEHPMLSEKRGLLRSLYAANGSRDPDPAWLEPDALVPCVCGTMARVVPCWRCEQQDANVFGA